MIDNKEKDELQYFFESSPDSIWTEKEIIQILGARGKRAGRIHTALRQLVASGELAPVRGGTAYALANPLDLVTGPLRMVRNGAGTVSDKKENKVYWVEPGDLGTALNGDIVTIRLYMRRGEAHGKIIRIVERSPHDIVGTFRAEGSFSVVTPLNPVYHKDFFVPKANGAKIGERVVVRFSSWDNPHSLPEGEIVDVIGPADKPSLDTKVVMRQFDLPETFPDEVIDEAERVAQRLKRPGKRLDLRKKFIFTIDPASAKDFDDAISFERDEQGRRVLGVHIADVSHFVRPESALDEEAYDRGTSVYLVDRVIPMLPEQLSNGVCSLRPDVDRLTFSVFITYDEKARPVACSFAKSRIRSKLRLNYEQALSVLRGQPFPKGVESIDIPEEARVAIKETWALASQLRQRRFAKGALDLDVPEVEVVLDSEGRMTRLETRPYDESHQMIEECMVAANEAVAAELWSNGVKIPARLHEPPDPEKLKELQAELNAAGLKTGNLSNPKNLAVFLRATANSPLQFHAHTLVLRSMKRAIYSAKQIGHFGLAKGYYAHFTSPIRRYPDLILHRQLADWLEKKNNSGRLPQSWLDQAAMQATEREQIADDASRQLVEIKKFRFLQQQLDEHKLVEYEAVISRCTNYGAFVDIPALAMGGIVHVSQLSRKFVRFNPSPQTLSAGDKLFKIGTRLKVVVCRVDFDARHADFAPSEREPVAIDRKKKLRPKSKRHVKSKKRR